MMAAAGIAEFDPFSPEVMTDPWEHYRWLRDNHPLYFIERYDMWVVSRFEDCWQLMADTSLPFHARESTQFSRSRALATAGGVVPPNPLEQLANFANIDPPHQGMLRGLINQPFRPGQVAKLEPWFRAMVRAELPALLATGRFNLTDAFGQWSARVMCRIAAIPESAAPRLRVMVNEFSDALGNPAESIDPGLMAELIGITTTSVQTRRAQGADGSCPFIDRAITGDIEGRALSDLQIAQQLVSPLVGGTETVPKIVAHGLWELSKRPEQLAAVRADLDTTASQAFEEMTRFCGPAQSFHRTAVESVEVGGERIRAGQRIAFVTASAGRDEREFDAADEFIWNRPIARSLAFGRGDHFCMGSHLARMEGKVMIQEFLASVSAFEIDEAAARKTVSSFQQGWDHLPVVIHAYGERPAPVGAPPAPATYN